MKANRKNAAEFRRDSSAVSPIVATLLLILVAAGAALGVNVWMKNFQGKATQNIATDKSTDTLKIGGSSTVFELTNKAITAWKGVHPEIVIDSQEGGSGAGKAAICKGLVDLGASSSAVKATGVAGQDLATCPDINPVDGVRDAGMTLQEFVVGYDAVVLAYSQGTLTTNCAANTINLSELDIKEIYAVNGGGQTAATPATLSAPSAGGLYAWKDLNTGTLAAPTHLCTGAGAIVLGSRSDQGGTEDGFCTKFFGSTTYTVAGVVTPACVAGTNQLTDSIFTSVNPQPGNDGIRTWLNGASGRMSFIGFGSVNEAGSGLKTGSMRDQTPTPATIKAAGISACAPAATDATHFCAARPLEYISAGAPTAVEQLFLDFMTQTQNNINFNHAAGYVSLYD